jgi:hypothetical protein
MASEKNLFDLHDYALFEIIKKLDHKSKMQLMATCKRFEGLIGQTFQFYKDFKFHYNQEKFQKTDDEDLAKMRRQFEIVEISGGRAKDILRTPIVEFLKKLGPQILKL